MVFRFYRCLKLKSKKILTFLKKEEGFILWKILIHRVMQELTETLSGFPQMQRSVDIATNFSGVSKIVLNVWAQKLSSIVKIP